MEDLTHQFLVFLMPAFQVIVFLLNMVSIFIILWGAVTACIDFFKNLVIKRSDQVAIALENNFIKAYLGSYVLLSLEVLIIADIIESIINPTFQDIIKLALIVIIRTVISYFLHREIDESPMQSETKQRMQSK
ncbi:DUF1622 domain-containing protein [Enterococcus sp. 669A]|uniref:DUF1622 domain-containing protein n=1 Tax=Candidatus Enterococcus moelleringii TaxID=2815325 RepID=A0ABS3LCV2_9ENTE|nr:DUF1622 domain-containing protein [Enterococcus sp. 669A]MBO1307464.1 DUF1622 domain-containing protein [Enterococcus sp. 669A]